MKARPESTILSPPVPPEAPAAAFAPSAQKPVSARIRRRRPDWPRVGIAAGLGLAVWLVIHLERTATWTVESLVEWGLPEDWALAPAPDQAAGRGPSPFFPVTLTLQGARQNLDGAASPEAIPISLARPLDGLAMETEEIIPLLDRIVHSGAVPKGIRVVRVDPPEAKLALCKVEPYSLAVEVVLQGEPAPGHRVASAEAEPPLVKVRGPQREKDRYTLANPTVRTEPVDVSGANGPVSLSRVRLARPEQEGLVLEAETVHVTVAVEPAPVTRQIGRVPVRLLSTARETWAGLPGLEAGAWADPPEVTVTVTGSVLSVENLAPESILVYTRPDQISLEGGKARLEAVPPHGVEGPIRLDPPEVTWRAGRPDPGP